ncbi:antibiotic biosynthesis monooxygenase family protein [Lutimonas halocynthiae]|uniref:putative quinol monooxygenase n=1 Tax=Lutimonas halocynthiae TaxID=1446477 RepID=UPI0025B29E55|nr:antibiotic biosynthesis monooxygenase family protein [Lutimonas halocynthiae]MDN3643408.1 antibiotic biosynthesis monooxygenase family protein [Lutimonas halocynthiae]
MLVRIVKMTFADEKIDDFQNRFHSIKEKIINFEGCQLLELYQDKENPAIFFTYSYWNSEDDLDRYRKSSFFKEVWTDTRKMFTEKAEAWSVDKIVSLNHP